MELLSIVCDRLHQRLSRAKAQCWLWGSTRNVPVWLPDSAFTLIFEVVAPCIVSKLKYILALKWYIEFNFKSCLRNCLPFVTIMHRPTHFFAPQSAVKHVQSSSAHCSKTVHLSKAAFSKLFTNPTGRHLVLPPAREMSNTHLVTQGDAKVKQGNTICALSHSKLVCSMKLLPF